MRLSVLFVLLTLYLGQTCGAQRTRETGPKCITAGRSGPLPKGPYKFLPGEAYKRSPLVRFQINKDGTVSNIRVIRSSGVADIDEKLVSAIRSWKYKPMPEYGVIDSEMTITIDWQ